MKPDMSFRPSSQGQIMFAGTRMGDPGGSRGSPRTKWYNIVVCRHLMAVSSWRTSQVHDGIMYLTTMQDAFTQGPREKLLYLPTIVPDHTRPGHKVYER